MKRYDTMGFESEHGVYVRWADAEAIIKEQSRLLTYILKYSGLESALPDGWVEDCKRILGEASQSTSKGEQA